VARPKGTRPYVIRTTSTQVAFWVGTVVLLVVVGTPLVRADWGLFGFVLPIALLIAWLLWILLYRPAVHYDDHGAVVVNIGRIHTLPWGHVLALQQRLNLIFELDNGTSVHAWGAPLPRGPGNVAQNFDRRTRPPVDEFHHNADVLDSYRRVAAPSDAPLSRRYDVVPLAIGAVLIVAVLVEFLIR
jgi:hypothetical protein